MKWPTTTLMIFLLAAGLYAAWENIRVNRTGFYSGDPSITVAGSTIAVAYESYEFGNDEIMLALSTNSGLTFQAPVRMTSNDSGSWRPKVALNDGVDLVFEDRRSGFREVFYARYASGAVSPALKISAGGVYSAFPSLTNRGRDLYIIWEDSRDLNDEIYFRKYEGGSWSAEKRLTFHDSTSWVGEIAVDTVTGNLHVVFFDFRTGNDEVYYISSADRGANWSTPVNLSNDPKNSWEPRVAAYNGRVAVSWYSFRDDHSCYEILYSENPGSGWTAPETISPLVADSKLPSISMSAEGTAVAWEDYKDGNDEIYTTYKAHGTSEWKTQRITDNGADSYGADLCLAGRNLHLAWFDYRDTVDQIYFAKGDAADITRRERASLHIQNTPARLLASPNPFRNGSTIRLTGLLKNAGSLNLKIYTAGGRNILDRSLTAENLCRGVSIDAGKYPAGTYLVSVRGWERELTCKMVVLK